MIFWLSATLITWEQFTSPNGQ